MRRRRAPPGGGVRGGADDALAPSVRQAGRVAPEEQDDELSGGRADLPRRWSWARGRVRGLVTPLGALVVVALVLVALGSGHREGQRRPPAGPTAGLPSDVPLPAALVVDGLCTALVEHDTDLVVTFRLLNRGGERVVIDDVSPSLPLGGLQPVEVGYTTGDCLRSIPAAPGVVLEPSEGVRVSFRLRLPPGCAAPYPVAASVDAHSAARGATSASLLVLPDLGALPLPHCAPGSWASPA